MFLHTNIGDLILITDQEDSLNFHLSTEKPMFVEMTINCLATTENQETLFAETIQAEKERVFDSQRARYNSYGYSTLEEFEAENLTTEQYQYIMLYAREENEQVVATATIHICGINKNNKGRSLEYCAEIPVEVPDELDIVRFFIFDKVCTNDFYKIKNAA